MRDEFIRRISLKTFFYKDVVIDNNVTGLVATGQQAADPNIIWDPLKKRWLIYFFVNVDGHSEIYVGESNDLLSVRFLGKALSRGSENDFDSVHAEKPCVIYHNNMYYMFYSGKDGVHSSIGLALSSDGVNYKKYSTNPILKDPEETGYLDAPSIIRWRDDNFYMWTYNGNGYNLIFKTTSDRFPLGWELIGKLESRFFGIYSVEAFYDEEIDKILILANIFYPKPSGVSEPLRTGHLAVYICDEPLKCVYGGALLISLQRDTRSYPLRYCQNNVYAPAITKIGRGRYVVLFNCTEDGDVRSERIYRIDLGVEKDQTLNITDKILTSKDYEKIILLRIPPGTKIILRHALIHVDKGDPSELYIWESSSLDEENIITWTDKKRLELEKDISINEEYLGISIKGTPPISANYSLKITIRPSIDEI